MPGDSSALVARAIAREPEAVRALVAELSPVIQLRVARALGRSPMIRGQSRSALQEVEDLAQEVFLAIFDNDARVLRGWDASRGASLATFIGMVADHQVASILRSGRRAPYRNDHEIGEVDFEGLPNKTAAPEARVASREMGVQLLERLRVELSPKGFSLFERLMVDEQPIESICKDTGMSADAVYAWRSRLGKLVRKLAADLEGMSEPADPPRIDSGGA